MGGNNVLEEFSLTCIAAFAASPNPKTLVGLGGLSIAVITPRTVAAYLCSGPGFGRALSKRNNVFSKLKVGESRVHFGLESLTKQKKTAIWRKN